jgi:GAF domain-containing protein
MKIPRATWAIVAVSVAGGAVTLAAAWRQPILGGVSQSQWAVAASMGVLALGSWLWPVVVYRRGESEAFNMDEGFFVTLALLVPPPVTVGTLAVATVLAQVAGPAPVTGQIGVQRRSGPRPEASLAPRHPGPGELAAPIIVSGQRQWLVASGRRRDEPFDDADRGLLRAVAAVGSAALSNAELYQQVRRERERLSSITSTSGKASAPSPRTGS